MPSRKRSFSLLVVSGKQQSSGLLTAMLGSFSLGQVDSALSAGEAKRKLLQCVYDVILVDTPLPDEFGTDFAIDSTQNSHTAVILMVKSDMYDRMCEKVEDFGVLTVSKPITKDELYKAVKLACAASSRLLNEEKRLAKLQDKLAETKLVSKAKFVLVEKKGMSEPEAHRYIEKEAMDSRRSKALVAQEIIDGD